MSCSNFNFIITSPTCLDKNKKCIKVKIDGVTHRVEREEWKKVKTVLTEQLEKKIIKNSKLKDLGTF